jgi:23S rRNA (pseudouridine1915-N3)-methyltransferase
MLGENMKITILTVGKLGRSVEADLARDYAARATGTGRALGLGLVDILEVEARKPGKVAEAEVLRAQIGDAYLICCDEHGQALPSRAFAAKVGKLRDDGNRRLVLVIGGADGIDPDLLAQARETLAFGVQTWPHALARVMLAEQVYRAASILAGSPYHRD